MKKNVELFKAVGAADEEMLTECKNAKPKKSRTIRFVALAASFCIVAVGALVWGNNYYNKPEQQQPTVSVSPDGVSIPKMQPNLSSDFAADMLAFFIYQGRCYVQYDSYGDNVFANDYAETYLGTSTGLIDEWTEKDGYVELAGSIATDFYTMKGYDPSFMLCSKENGMVFINNNGITLKKGADLFETRLHLNGNYASVDAQTRKAWYYDSSEAVEIVGQNDVLSQFVAALNEADFVPLSDIPYDKSEQSSVYDAAEIYHMFFNMNNGITVHLRLFEGGYVSFSGIHDVCVKLPDEVFAQTVNMLGQATA